MTKEGILKEIEGIVKENGEYDLTYDEQTERLFYEIGLKIELPFDVYSRQITDDGWLQAEYYSSKLGKTIIWNYDVGNFDDYDEVADFIIDTSKEIEDFERQLPNLSVCA